MSGLAISRPDPIYPAIAKAAHVQGIVVLHALISKTGTIENLTVISGSPMLTQAPRSMECNGGGISPIMLSGEPVEVETTISVNFTFGGWTDRDGRAAKFATFFPARYVRGYRVTSIFARHLTGWRSCPSATKFNVLRFINQEERSQ